MSAVLLALVCVAMVSSCASLEDFKGASDGGAGVVTASVPRAYEDVWKATMLAFADVPLDVIDRDRGFLQSQWMEGWGEKRFGILSGVGSGGSWQRRVRVMAWFHPAGQATDIKIRMDTQEKPPGGAMAMRWVRVAPEAEQVKDVLREIERHLGNLKHSA